MNLEKLKFPVGRFTYSPVKNMDLTTNWIEHIRLFPILLTEVTSKFSESQWNNTYRPDGWTARQVVHHVADSHSHAYLRFKTAITEQNPTIKPYFEERYATLADYQMDIAPSISILQGVHSRWSTLLGKFIQDDWEKGYFHPESGKFFTLHEALALYDWHCKHHMAHLKLCQNKK